MLENTFASDVDVLVPIRTDMTFAGFVFLLAKSWSARAFVGTELFGWPFGFEFAVTDRAGFDK